MVQDPSLICFVKEGGREHSGLALGQLFQTLQQGLVNKQACQLIELSAQGVRHILNCRQFAQATAQGTEATVSQSDI